MLSTITPTSPVAPWLGGKRNLAKRICAIIDATPCVTYAEPFVGMGGIFLRRTTRPKAEVINDRGRDIANLFRILQRHYPQFLDTLRFQLTTRAEFERLIAVDPDTLSATGANIMAMAVRTRTDNTRSDRTGKTRTAACTRR